MSVNRSNNDLGYFYILYSGAAFKSEGVFNITGQKVTGYFETGDVFGEAEALNYGKSREHSVTCSRDSLVLACYRDMYFKVSNERAIFETERDRGSERKIETDRESKRQRDGERIRKRQRKKEIPM